jgi:hypothetical protein
LGKWEFRVEEVMKEREEQVSIVQGRDLPVGV